MWDIPYEKYFKQMCHTRKFVDICFVLDATNHNQSVFTALIDYTLDISLDLCLSDRRSEYYFGAVIYRDPIGYKEPGQTLDALEIENLLEIHQQKIKRRKELNLYSEELENTKQENQKFIDLKSYPINKNVGIEFNDDIYNISFELQQIKCGGGTNGADDWAGALKIALEDLKWHDRGRKYIIWISDSNAHGKRFCGIDEFNEEEEKMTKLIERMIENGISIGCINIIKSDYDRGSEMTLQEMKRIYKEHKSRNNNTTCFSIEEFYPRYDLELYDEDEWPPNVIDEFNETIRKTFIKLGFDL